MSDHPPRWHPEVVGRRHRRGNWRSPFRGDRHRGGPEVGDRLPTGVPVSAWQLRRRRSSPMGSPAEITAESVLLQRRAATPSPGTCLIIWARGEKDHRLLRTVVNPEFVVSPARSASPPVCCSTPSTTSARLDDDSTESASSTLCESVGSVEAVKLAWDYVHDHPPRSRPDHPSVTSPRTDRGLCPCRPRPAWHH